MSYNFVNKVHYHAISVLFLNGSVFQEPCHTHTAASWYRITSCAVGHPHPYGQNRVRLRH